MSVNLPRVLIIDDQPAICTVLRRALQSRYAVEVAIGGAAAVARIRSDDDYSLILCDLAMPDVSGLDVLEVVENEAPRLLPRVVVMTGKVCAEDELRRLMELGVNVLHKPFGSADLLTLVQGYLVAARGR